MSLVGPAVQYIVDASCDLHGWVLNDPQDKERMRAYGIELLGTPLPLEKAEYFSGQRSLTLSVFTSADGVSSRFINSRCWDEGGGLQNSTGSTTRHLVTPYPLWDGS
jgi:hypothetical protein